MEGLSRGVLVKSCVVYYSSWGSIVFSCNDHAAAPRDRIINSYFLQDAQADISVQSIFNWLLPVKRDLTGSVDSHRPSLLVNKDPERRGAVHQVEGLVLADIEGTGLVPVQDVLSELGNILRCRGTGEDRRGLGRELTSGT